MKNKNNEIIKKVEVFRLELIQNASKRILNQNLEIANFSRETFFPGTWQTCAGLEFSPDFGTGTYHNHFCIHLFNFTSENY